MKDSSMNRQEINITIPNNNRFDRKTSKKLNRKKIKSFISYLSIIISFIIIVFTLFCIKAKVTYINELILSINDKNITITQISKSIEYAENNINALNKDKLLITHNIELGKDKSNNLKAKISSNNNIIHSLQENYNELGKLLSFELRKIFHSHVPKQWNKYHYNPIIDPFIHTRYPIDYEFGGKGGGHMDF